MPLPRGAPAGHQGRGAACGVFVLKDRSGCPLGLAHLDYGESLAGWSRHLLTLEGSSQS